VPQAAPPTPRPHQPAHLAVFLSGGGRSLDNLRAAIARGDLPASIPLVIASRPCPGADKARAAGIETHILPGTLHADTLAPLLNRHAIDFIVLAGYLRLLPIPPGFQGRVVNIHPALLPAFGGPGMHGHHVHQAVLAARATESGCTVHLCDDRYDTGPILLQRRCPVLPTDSPDTLAARVFEHECLAYPEALRQLIASTGPRAQP
jgi:phosphoribosylglycinamide formyltransferase-1